MRWVITLLLTLAFAATWTRADGLVHRLPEDGTAVRFGLEMKMSFGGMEKSASGEFIQRSVGKVEVDGKPCRWIEFKMSFEADGKKITNLCKVLVPESALKSGENPGAQMIRGWVQLLEKGQPEEIKDLQNQKAGPIAAFLAGPLTDAKQLGKETIDSKLGKLECAGVTGTLLLEPGNNEKVSVKMENRLHEKAPFGVVRCRMEFSIERDGQAQGNGYLLLNVLEATKDAKSELPEQK